MSIAEHGIEYDYSFYSQTLTYQNICTTEELYGDLKKHGFDLEKTMLQDFLKLSRLTLAVAFLYAWLISVGGGEIRQGFRHLVDRP